MCQFPSKIPEDLPFKLNNCYLQELVIKAVFMLKHRRLVNIIFSAFAFGTALITILCEQVIAFGFSCQPKRTQGTQTDKKCDFSCNIEQEILKPCLLKDIHLTLDA